MGLDVALGVIILIAAIRGWLQGFIYQVIRIGGLIACVYLAAPVRDQVKPHVRSYLPSIQPELMDRLLWWVSASVSYIVIVGASTLALKMTRRPEVPGVPPERSRNDQFAGFLLGLAKGALVAAFLVAGLTEYGLKQIESIPWAQKQTSSSQAIVWDGQYHPASRIWDSVPVRHFVSHIRRMGLQAPGESSPDETTEEAGDQPVVQTARRGPAEGSSKAARRREAQSPPPAAPATEASDDDPPGAAPVEKIKPAADATKPK